MLFKNRHLPRNAATGLFFTAEDLEELGDQAHDQDANNLRMTKREAAQKRELRRSKQPARVGQQRPTHSFFNGEELDEEAGFYALSHHAV